MNKDGDFLDCDLHSLSVLDNTLLLFRGGSLCKCNNFIIPAQESWYISDVVLGRIYGFLYLLNLWIDCGSLQVTVRCSESYQ